MTQSLPNGHPLLAILAKLRDHFRDPRGQRNLASINEPKECGGRQLLRERHHPQDVVDFCFPAAALVRVTNRFMHDDTTAAGDQDHRAVGHPLLNIGFDRSSKQDELRFVHANLRRRAEECHDRSSRAVAFTRRILPRCFHRLLDGKTSESLPGCPQASVQSARQLHYSLVMLALRATSPRRTYSAWVSSANSSAEEPLGENPEAV